LGAGGAYMDSPMVQGGYNMTNEMMMQNQMMNQQVNQQMMLQQTGPQIISQPGNSQFMSQQTNSQFVDQMGNPQMIPNAYHPMPGQIMGYNQIQMQQMMIPQQVVYNQQPGMGPVMVNSQMVNVNGMNQPVYGMY